jgi:F-type H+-transporting ATPase subunit alpha
MMELLKQWVYSPVTVEKQICSIYAGWKGYLDAISVSKVGKFEHDLYSTLDEEKSILESISKEKQMNEDTEKKLIEVIKKVVELNK